MSKVIQVRNVPDDVHASLRGQAAAAGVSLSEYVLTELTQVAGRSTNAQILLRAALRPGGFSREEIVEAVRSGRDER
ncbi:MAG: hypothetical protein M3R66_10840 [Actinomycetota bacterium]|jgi:plasmid stability protein|nr:hypothetical protein [Geodermatophilaceae bacterium]MDQ3054281.1 hypothetical protein [Actinomycetota bacterium]